MKTKKDGKIIIAEDHAKVLLQIVNQSEFKGSSVELICKIKKALRGD